MSGYDFFLPCDTYESTNPCCLITGGGGGVAFVFALTVYRLNDPIEITRPGNVGR